MSKNVFLMPDYLPAFACKMGECRNACCVGWPISFSLADYFRLGGMDCSAELREKLDRAIRIHLHPSPERYAQFSPRYDGNCPLHLPDGLCALHAEMGGDALTDVCRLYPRGIRRNAKGYEISCANSCEAVTELLLAKQEPLRFEEQELDILLPPLGDPKPNPAWLGQEREIRFAFLRTVQNRSLSLPNRLAVLGQQMREVEKVLTNGDKTELCGVLSAPPKILSDMRQKNPTPELLEKGLFTVEKLLEKLDARSNSIHDYGEESLRRFTEADDPFSRYSILHDGFSKRVPDWERGFEQLLVNHMFFTEFPVSGSPEQMPEEYIALCTVYALLRFLCLGKLAKEGSETDLADLCAALFRLTEHTDFDRYAVRTLKEIYGADPTVADELILL